MFILKGIADLFKEKGFNVCYHSGNLNTLKHDLENSGTPIIVMIRIQKDKNSVPPISGGTELEYVKN